MRLYQLTPNITTGDGVSQGVRFTANLLMQLGFEQAILAEIIDPALQDQVAYPSAIHPTQDDVLLYHHSVGVSASLEKWIQDFPGKRLLIYHNITPASFFPVGSAHHYACELGRKQLSQWSDLFQACLADSDYNKRELDNLGYAQTLTLPLLFDIHQLEQQAQQPAPNRADNAVNLLFVGRIAPNKCQHQLIELLPYLIQRTSLPLKLALIGGISTPEYQHYLTERIAQLGLASQVQLLGKVDAHALHSAYAQADLFISLSEHEGFGIPLIEAMVYDVPVLAYPAGAIASTLAGAGLILPSKHLPTLADAIVKLIHQPWQRHALIQQQRQRLQALTPQRLAQQLATWLAQHGVKTSPSSDTKTASTQMSGAHTPVRHWQFQGPYDSSYSLALVNRELALALQAKGEQVSFYSTEGLGDYPANQSWLATHAPECLSLQDEQLRRQPGKIALRNLYPPRLSDSYADLTLLGPYGWEESSFPADWVAQINARAHAVATMSHYVADVLRANGVSVPLLVTGIGADHILRQPAQQIDDLLLPSQPPLFLHISSAFARKGVDILIDAFTRAFAPWQAASLIIKTFANPHNQVNEQLQDQGWQPQSENDAAIQIWRRSAQDQCQVVVIWRELSNAQLRWLYENTTALVAPTRGEGFGLPQAEAMFCCLPVITTNQGGQADFCNEQTAWLIPSQVEPAQSHMQLPNSLWFEPDVVVLIQYLRAFAQGSAELNVPSKLAVAHNHIKQHYTWSVVAQKLAQAIQDGSLRSTESSKGLGLVTTWNQRCGIATYSRFLSQAFPDHQWQVFAPFVDTQVQPDETNVTRCWYMGQQDDLKALLAAIQQQPLSRVLIQFNFSFFRLAALANLIEQLTASGIRVFITLHATADVAPQHGAKSLREIKDALGKAELLVHSVTDVQRLADWCIASTSFPHGVYQPSTQRVSTPLDTQLQLWKAQSSPILASYGFLLPHKGIPELIQAFEQLKTQFAQLKLLLLTAEYPAPASQALRAECMAQIGQSAYASDICLFTEFTQEEQALAILKQVSCIVMPYQHTQESSSAAVRFALAAARPVCVTPLDIFQDVATQVIYLPGTRPEQLAAGLAPQLRQPSINEEDRRRWLQAHDWRWLSQRLWNLIRFSQ